MRRAVMRRAVAIALAWILFASLVSGVVIAARLSSDAKRRGFEYMPDMARSIAYHAYAVNPVTRDGKTLQVPVEGTRPRGFVPFPYGPLPEDAVRAGIELRNPIPRGELALARGRVLFETFCAVCHGASGLGDGPLIPRIPNPPSYRSMRVRSMQPGQLFHVISRGSGRMPSYATQIPTNDRWLIVHYVEMLRAQGDAK